MIEQPAQLQDITLEQARADLERLAGTPVEVPAQHAPTVDLPPRQPDLPAWSLQSYADLVEALPDGVVVVNEAGVIVLVNQQVLQLFGYARDELLGHAVEILVPERFRAGHVGQRQG